MATRAAIKRLKRDWLDDPWWDIYATDGFEAHQTELTVFQERWERRWERRYQRELQEKSERLGIPGNIELVKYINDLEERIDDLRRELDRAVGE